MRTAATDTGAGPLTLAAGFVLMFFASVGLELQSEHETQPQSAAAVLAWAQSNCDSELELAPGAARTHAEVLLQVAAAFDADARNRGIRSACETALTISRVVAAQRG